MNKFVRITKEINDAASLGIVADEYFDGDNVNLDEVFQGLRNIIQKVVDGHHQSRELAMVAIKIIDKSGEE